MSLTVHTHREALLLALGCVVQNAANHIGKGGATHSNMMSQLLFVSWTNLLTLAPRIPFGRWICNHLLCGMRCKVTLRWNGDASSHQASTYFSAGHNNVTHVCVYLKQFNCSLLQIVSMPRSNIFCRFQVNGAAWLNWLLVTEIETVSENYAGLKNLTHKYSFIWFETYLMDNLYYRHEVIEIAELNELFYRMGGEEMYCMRHRYHDGSKWWTDSLQTCSHRCLVCSTNDRMQKEVHNRYRVIDKVSQYLM